MRNRTVRLALENDRNDRTFDTGTTKLAASVKDDSTKTDRRLKTREK